MGKKRLYQGLIALGGCHLLLVVLGASYIDLEPMGPVGQVLNFYGEMSGANRSYGFFAPGVGSQVRTQFEVVGKNGSSETISLERTGSHEADIRIANITNQLGNDGEGEQREAANELRRSMAASLAGKVFGRYPGAQAVVVHVDEFEPVNMPEYRKGERPKWEEIYSARFVQDTAQAEATL